MKLKQQLPKTEPLTPVEGAYLREIARMFDVQLRIVPRLRETSAYVDLQAELITLAYHEYGYLLDSQRIISAFFHELAHIIIKREGKFPIYNELRPGSRKAFRATAWRAEMYTDKRAKQLMNEYFPGTKFLGAYSTKHKSWILDYFD